ncbi:MAG: hypothetical protein J6Y03_03540 [Alphaproteobacteria bacterium]|nr:hypothetical protein [Alphaproteobacteria bacterium]
MKKVLLCLLLLFSTTAFGKIEVYFSPSTDCEDKLVDLINNSTETIDVAVYSINNDNIVNALKKAQDRGVRMRVLTDRTQASGKSSKVRELYDSGVNIKVHSKHKIEHNKFAIFDGKMASTGSYNWTNPASNKNSENCVFFIEEQEVIAKYQERFDYLWEINTKNASDTWFNKFSK